MRAIVVYESMFGNTGELARSIGQGLTDAGWEATVGRTDDIRPDDLEVDLLVVGAPTHMNGLSWLPTRRFARFASVHRVPEDVPETHVGIRRWLRRCTAGQRRPAAVFDTSIEHPKAGRAAGALATRLEKRGWRLVVAPASFHVFDVHGGWKGQELERGRAWGQQIGRTASTDASV